MDGSRPLRDREELVGIHRGNPCRVEIAHPLLQEVGTEEGPLHRYLLIEQHADDQRERIVFEQSVRVFVAGDRELRHRASSCPNVPG